jgi:DNA mismatch repair protein MutS
MSNLIDEYFATQERYQKQYGRNTLYLIQVGSFFEAYQTADEGHDLMKISNMLNVVLSKKNKSIAAVDRKNPYMMGFPCPALSKYLRVLMDNGYTVVLCEQVTPPPNPKREITNIFSPGTYLEESGQPDNNYILSVFVEEVADLKSKRPAFLVGLAMIDLTTGQSVVHEVNSDAGDDKLALDEAIKFVNAYNAREILLTTSGVASMARDELEAYLEVSSKILHHRTLAELQAIKGYKTIVSVAFQQEMFGKVYPVVNTLSPIEYLELETRALARNAFAILVQYCFDHNPNFITRLELPSVYQRDRVMHLGNNAVHQLNVFPSCGKDHLGAQSSVRSLFDVVNKTSTPMGRRFLKAALASPLVDPCELQRRYDLIAGIAAADLETELSAAMSQVGDIERLQRKMALGTLHPMDLANWHQGQARTREVLQLLTSKDVGGGLVEAARGALDQQAVMLADFEGVFLVEELSKHLLNDITTNFFVEGVHPELDKIQDELNVCTKFMDALATTLGAMIDDTSKLTGKGFKKSQDTDSFIRVESNERDGYYLSLTKRRAEILERELKKKVEVKVRIGNKDHVVEVEKLTFKHALKGTNSKISLPDLEKNSERVIVLTSKLRALAKERYLEHLTGLVRDHGAAMRAVLQVLVDADFAKSGAAVAKAYRYCRPTLVEQEKSFLRAKTLRHPIVERINADTDYVPVDVHLGVDGQDGMLLFGLNSAGKSTLQKAVGIAVILAQIGYYVPATAFEFCPYRSIFTRISGNDNLFKGLSSFTLELVELRAILKRSGANTLVIADEVCKGTEHQSSLIIVMAMVEMLARSGTSFVTATHLHELCDMPRLAALDNVRKFHLHVEFDEKNHRLVYDRQLRPGSGLNFYGLQVAKYLMEDPAFIETATAIHKEMGTAPLLVGDKKSRYNAAVHMTRCEVCHVVPKPGEVPLETHHIVFQKDCDADGFIVSAKKAPKHKNKRTNLVVLCQRCHDQVDAGRLQIDGYEETSHGLNLVHRKKSIKQSTVVSCT